jgi:hypothetical protein
VRILCDRHQADLLYSLQLLFEDRLGLDLYVPVGMGWWEEGYWQFGRVYGDDRLARQFLAIDANWTPARGVHFHHANDRAIKCDSPGCTSGDSDLQPGGWMTTIDHHHPLRPIRGVTLDQFRELGDWAFVVATVQDNQHGFHRLAGEAGARYVLQVGNTAQQVDWSLDPLALVSSEVPIEGRGVRYHQEFDSDGVFGYVNPRNCVPHLVSSFVNCFPSTDRWPVLERYREALHEFGFRVHGIDGPDGNVHPVEKIALTMGASGWGWHDKPQGDGFGHVIHNWAAIGRPLIGRAAHYRGRLAEGLWEDGVTCVDLDARDFDGNVRLIREISADPVRHGQMSMAIRARFDELVDYDREEQEIRALLGL